MLGSTHLVIAGSSLALAGLLGCGSGDDDAADAGGNGGDGSSSIDAAPGTPDAGSTNIEETRLYYYPTGYPLTLKSVRVDGTDVQEHGLIGDAPKTVRHFGMSPDATKIVFHLALGASDPDGLHIFDVAAGTESKLGDFNPIYRRWSPDSQRILMEDNDEIIIVDMTGTTVAQHSHIDYEISNVDVPVAWSPDGTKVAFAYSVFGHEELGHRIVVTDPSFSTYTEGTQFDTGIFDIYWTASNRIVGVHFGGVHIFDSEGTLQNSYDYPGDWSVRGSPDAWLRQLFLPQPHPDGDRIVILRDENGGYTDIYIMNLDLTGAQLIVGDLAMINDDEFMLAPSGNAVYVREATSRVVTLDGTTFSTFPDPMRSAHVVGWH